MRFKKISARMLAVIVPILIASMAILTVISVVNSSQTINEQIQSRMEAELSAAEKGIEDKLGAVSTMATVEADMLGQTYKSMTPEDIEKALSSVIMGNEMVLGSGVWFEPFVYDEEQEYFGPYAYKDGSSVVVTYDYSNADYDYFSQEYYTAAKASSSYIITNPYYDPTSNVVMSSCSAPIIADGTYIGCVTVDMELGTVSAMVEEIKVGKAGSAILLDSTGVYLAGVESDKVSAGQTITSDSNTSLAAAGSAVMAGESGQTTYKSPTLGTMSVHFATVPSTGWKLMVQIPYSEIQKPIMNLMLLMIVIAVVFLVIEVIIVILQIRSISKGITRVKAFAGSLAEGDFSVEPIDVKTADELGVMSSSLNDMYDSNKDVISIIANYSVDIDSQARKLNDTSKELIDLFDGIKVKIGQVNEDMMTTSAASEEVNASSEEVLSNVNLLAGETEDTLRMSREIMDRAGEVESKSRTSFDTAQDLTEQFQGRLAKSIENAQVVEKISEMADVISNIAEQINLLSLNASIEAARAGEAGRGFAVVATEIGNLAGNTTEAVTEIQKTIAEVQGAFSELTEEARGLLGFLQDTVSPDYQNFVEVASQYGEDAKSFGETSVRISEMAGNIKSIMGEVTDAIQAVAEATQETTDISTQMADSVDAVSQHVEDVANMSDAQQQIADTLTETVGRFKLES